MSMASYMDEEVRAVITNIMGEKVKELVIRSNGRNDVALGNVSGVYFLTATTGRGRYVARVIVE